MEELDFKLDDIKEIRLNHDFEDVRIPRNMIKNIYYEYNHVKTKYYQHYVYLSELHLELDLDFVMNENSFFDFDKINDKKNIDCLKYNNVWYVGITFNDREDEYILEVPFFSKDYFFNHDKNTYNYSNSFEKHSINNNSYIIDWVEDKPLTMMNIDEMYELFLNKKGRGAPVNNNFFQLEAFYRILNYKNHLDWKNTLELFCKFDNENNIDGIQSDYVINLETNIDDYISSCNLVIKNDSNSIDITYLFVGASNDYQKIKEYITSISDKDFNKSIVVIDDTIKMTELIGIDMNNIIIMTLSELNDIIYQMICEYGFGY